MQEDDKKFSFLNHLDTILQNNFVNDEVVEYEFYSMNTLIVNHVTHDVKDNIVKIILYLDELLIEINEKDGKCHSYSLPYNFIDEIHIILKEGKYDK